MMDIFGTRIAFAVVLSVILGFTESARRVDFTQSRHHISKRSLHIRSTSPDELVGLRGEEHLVTGNKVKTKSGTTKVKMSETYKGIPVVGESVVLEIDENGHYTGDISGRLLENIEEDIVSTEPSLTKENVLEICIRKYKDMYNKVILDKEKDVTLQVYVTGIDDIHAHLIYRVNYRIETAHKTSRPTCLIDANSGKILKDWDAISMSSWRKRKIQNENEILKYKLIEGAGGNNKTGKYLYGLDLPELRVQHSDDGTCVLENQYALIYNCNNSYDCTLENLQPHHFICEEGNNDAVNGAYSPLNDALFYVGITYEMYADWYEISDPLKTIDKNGGRCTTRVHYGEFYENAFWDGEQITFGDGANKMYPLTSLNIIAHEISHGFTEVNSGLIYNGESGGMNEAFSDMAGEAVEEYLRHKIDWMVGFGIWKPENESMRYFDDPTKDGKSINTAEDMCFNLDPHQSSGVYNKAFYLLANKPGWCVRKAFHIFLVANDLYWHPDSGFNDGACDVMKAARDLGYNDEDVREAFEATGVMPCNTSLGNIFAMMRPLANNSAVTYNFSVPKTELQTSHVLLFFRSTNTMYLDVTTRFNRYQVEGPGNFPPMLNLGPQCNQDLGSCSVTLRSQVEAQYIIFPLSVFDVIIGSQDLDSNFNDSQSANVMVNFTIPEVIIKNRMKVLILGTTIKGGAMLYIRHELPPNTDSREYDGRGHSNKRGVIPYEPLFICVPKEGVYYLLIRPFTVFPGEPEGIRDFRLEMAVWLTGEKVELVQETETSTGGSTESEESEESEERIGALRALLQNK